MRQYAGSGSVGSPWQSVTLHLALCECSSCRPWPNWTTTGGGYASQVLLVPRFLWDELGRPASIEEFARRRAAGGGSSDRTDFRHPWMKLLP